MKAYSLALLLGLFLTTHSAFSALPVTPTIFPVSEGGDHSAPQAFHVSALPDVQGTIPLSGCPILTGYSGDLEDAPVTVWPNQSTQTRLGVMNCIRKRDQAYTDYVSTHFLGGGGLVKSQFFWDFGDPSAQYNQVKGFSASHVYNTPGTYTVTLTIKNDLGVTGSVKIQTLVSPNTRKPYFINSFTGSDANLGTTQDKPWKTLAPLLKLPPGNRDIQLYRTGLYSLGAGQQIRLSSNDWVHGYGTTSWATLQGQGQNLFTFDPHASHMAVTGLKLDSLPGTTAGLGNVYGKNILIRQNALGRINTFLEISGFAYGTQTQGILVQNNGNPPINGVWSTDVSSSYFAFISAKQVALYGNWIKIKAPLGQPVMRTCGTKVQDISLISNHVFGDVTNKHDPVSIRNGRNIYLGQNTIYSGSSNFGSHCSPNSGPNEAVNNSVIENNTFEDAYLEIEGGNLNLRASGNVFHQNNPSLSDIQPYDSMVISGSHADIPTTTGLSITSNTVLDDNAFGRFISFYTNDPKSIELMNNTVYAPKWANTYYNAIPYQSHSPATQTMGIFTKIASNRYFLTLPVKGLVNFGDGVQSLDYWNRFSSTPDQILDVTKTVIPTPDKGVAK